MADIKDQSSNLERRLMRLYERVGGVGLVALVTLFSILMSVLLTLSIVWPLTSDDADQSRKLWIYITVATVVPSVVAPLATSMQMRLIRRLNQAYDLATTLATTDPLTGVANRRGFFEAIARQPHDHLGGRRRLLGILDADNFKALNDNYGHAAGDAALVALTRQLQTVVGATGFVGRLGGDEFSFVLTVDEDEVESRKLAVEAKCHRVSLDLPQIETPVTLQTSIGLAIQEPGETLEETLARADERLYAMKFSGRTRDNRRVFVDNNTIPTVRKKGERTPAASWDDHC